MTLASTTPAPPPAAPDEFAEPIAPRHWPYRMSLEVYERIGELGIIRPEEHVVLLDGLLVQTMTKGPDHSYSMLKGQDILRAACPRGWHIRPEQPIALPDEQGGDSEPEPDLSLIRGTIDDYLGRHPRPGDVGLIIEVATTAAMFAQDRVGLRRYAYAGIPTVWIATLYDRKVHIYTEPGGPNEAPAYGRVEVKQAGDLIEATLPSPGPDQPPTVLGPVAVASFFRPIP